MFCSHLVQRREGDITGCADQGIETPGLFEQAANRSAVADIYLIVAAAAADAQHFMTLFQLFGHRRTDGAVGADQQDFH
ncbi:hypothetical protein D3C72_1883570 [compost metagenome]